MWACRVAEQSRVICPVCGRDVQARHLKYNHICKGTPEQRAVEAGENAIAGFRERTLKKNLKEPKSTAFAELDGLLTNPPPRHSLF